MAEAPPIGDGRVALPPAADWIQRPFDVSTLLCFALVVTLGLGSWLGGAIVDHLLDATLRSAAAAAIQRSGRRPIPSRPLTRRPAV